MDHRKDKGMKSDKDEMKGKGIGWGRDQRGDRWLTDQGEIKGIGSAEGIRGGKLVGRPG